MRRFLTPLISLFYIGILLLSCTPKSSDSTVRADEKTGEGDDVRSPASFFPAERAKALVVGTFHFDNPGLDAHQVDEKNVLDILSETRQLEVREVLDYIKKFKPTKLAIEAWPDWDAVGKLKAYQEGSMELGRDERHQLGLRLAAELEFDTIYSIDADNMANDLGKIIPEYTDELFKDFDFKSDDPLDAMIGEWMEYDDMLAKSMNLLEYLKYINSRESHQYGYGIYLTGDFKLDNQRGADILAAWWYNRNLRIFRNLQAITTGKDDRIVLLFGNGHAAIFRQLLECSPEYEFIEFDRL